MEFHQARAVAGTSEPASRPARFEIPFRADIEALRGIAVLAVVLYHAFPDVVRGGFLGVDVFFVLSGFLITQLLLRELEATGRIDLLAFWGRRFRRIAPAAIFVVLAVAALSFAFFALDGKRLGRHMIAAALSYYNWRQVSLSVDYLAKDDASNPLMHYWSLSVEEQFYVIWPLFLLCIVMLGARRPTLTICAALLAALSFALAMYFAATEPSRAFFGTDARAWQLLAGALVAMVPLRPVFAGKDIAAGAAIAVLALCCATMTGQPAAFALVPTIATAMVLWIGADWLAAPPLRYLGRVSFSWYLWHWPLIVLLGATPAGLAAALALSFLAAVGTYHAIEQPFRRNLLLTRSAALACGCGIALVAVGALAGVGMRRWGLDQVYAGQGQWLSRSAVWADSPGIYNDGCLLWNTTVQKPCVYGNVKGPTVVLFGDSHAGNWFTPLQHAAVEAGWRLVVRVKASCPPVEGFGSTECTEWRERTLRELEANPPDVAILAGKGNHSPEAERAILVRLGRVGRVFAVRDTPRWPKPTLDCLAAAKQPEDCRWPLASRIDAKSYPALREIGLPLNTTVLDFNDRVCPGGTCDLLAGGWPIMFDTNHMTATFCKRFAADFERLLTAGDTIATGSTR